MQGPELFGSSGRRRHGASVRSRDGVPQKGPPREQSRCRMWHGCMARSTALEHGKGQEERASWGTYNAARGALRAPFLKLRGVLQAPRSLLIARRTKMLFGSLGLKSRGTIKRAPRDHARGARMRTSTPFTDPRVRARGPAYTE